MPVIALCMIILFIMYYTVLLELDNALKNIHNILMAFTNTIKWRRIIYMNDFCVEQYISRRHRGNVRSFGIDFSLSL